MEEEYRLDQKRENLRGPLLCSRPGGEKRRSLGRRQVKQNFRFQKTGLDLTDFEGIFFQRQFQKERNVKVQIFQITFSTRQFL